mgnify:FL=1
MTKAKYNRGKRSSTPILSKRYGTFSHNFLAGSEASVVSKGKDVKGKLSLTPGFSFGGKQFGAGSFNLYGKGGITVDKGSGKKKFNIGGGGKWSFGKNWGNPRELDTRFLGDIKAEHTQDVHTKKRKTTGRLSLGFGKPGEHGTDFGGGNCSGDWCYGSGYGGEYTGWNVKGFGEYDTKTKSPKVGISGRYGIFRGEGKFDLKTKKPEFKFGLNIPFNK